MKTCKIRLLSPVIWRGGPGAGVQYAVACRRWGSYAAGGGAASSSKATAISAARQIAVEAVCAVAPAIGSRNGGWFETFVS